MPTLRLFTRIALILILAVVPYSLIAQSAPLAQPPAQAPAAAAPAPRAPLSWADQILQQDTYATREPHSRRCRARCVLWRR